jgi:hypothetical protein
LAEYAPHELSAMLCRQFGQVELNGMSADEAIIGRELARSRALKWATLPFTFPGAPERLRQAGLGRLKSVKAWMRRGDAAMRQSPGIPEGNGGGAGHVPVAPAYYPYDETAITIGPGRYPSVNIVAVAKA